MGSFIDLHFRIFVSDQKFYLLVHSANKEHLRATLCLTRDASLSKKTSSLPTIMEFVVFLVRSVVLNVVDMYTSTENTMTVVLYPYCTLIPFYKNIMSLSIRITIFPSYKFTTDYTCIRIILEFWVYFR